MRPHCGTWPFPGSDEDIATAADNAAMHVARGCCSGRVFTAPPPAATPPPEPAATWTDFDGWVSMMRRSAEQLRASGFTTPARVLDQITDERVAQVYPGSTPAPGVSGETREALQAIACSWHSEERPPCTRFEASSCYAAVSALIKAGVLAALAPGPDTALIWCEDCQDSFPPGHRGPDTARDGERTQDPISKGIIAQAQRELDAARRALDDLKAAVEKLAADFQQRSDKAANERGGYPEAVADKDARERCWNRAAEDLASLLSPPDAGRDTG